MYASAPCTATVFFFQAEDGIRDYKVTWSSDVCSSDLRPLRQVSSSSLGITVNPPTYSIGETFCLRGGEVHRLTALFNSIAYWRRATMTAGYVAILCAALIAGASARPDESSSDSVGVIDGEAISVTGPMSVEVVHGRVKTVLRSGSEVRVKSGTARDRKSTRLNSSHL